MVCCASVAGVCLCDKRIGSVCVGGSIRWGAGRDEQVGYPRSYTADSLGGANRGRKGGVGYHEF